jgi:3D (Asp-Asp-Asp) domain-containing protein
LINILNIFRLIVLISILSGCTIQPTLKEKLKPIEKYNVLVVTATAYTSRRKETDRTPYLAAWMNRLRPSVKSIAVSRDLLKLGLTNGAIVTIDGYKHRYKVLDKMNKRWEKKIDIYMGNNRGRALRWGKQPVTIRWEKTEAQLLHEKRRRESIIYHLIALFYETF